MKKLIFSLLLTLNSSICLTAQWATIGNSNHAAPIPRITNSNPHIELNSTEAYSGLRFLKGGSPDGWLWYNTSTNELGFNISQSSTNAAMTIDRDNGYFLLRKSNSRIGVGTDNPLSAVHIRKTGFSDLRLESGSNSTSRILFYNGNSQNGMISQDDEEMHVYNLVPAGIMRIGMDNNDLVILANGNTGIGISSPSYKLHVNGNTHIIGELSSTSDRILKKNILPITDALETISRLNPVRFIYRTEEFKNLNLAEGDRLGLIAQEVRDVLPQLVSEASSINMKGEETNYLGVNYIELIPLLIKSVQELKEQNQAKDKIISDLLSRQEAFSTLEIRIAKLEANLKSESH